MIVLRGVYMKLLWQLCRVYICSGKGVRANWRTHHEGICGRERRDPCICYIYTMRQRVIKSISLTLYPVETASSALQAGWPQSHSVWLWEGSLGDLRVTLYGCEKGLWVTSESPFTVVRRVSLTQQGSKPDLSFPYPTSQSLYQLIYSRFLMAAV